MMLTLEQQIRVRAMLGWFSIATIAETLGVTVNAIIDYLEMGE